MERIFPPDVRSNPIITFSLNDTLIKHLDTNNPDSMTATIKFVEGGLSFLGPNKNEILFYKLDYSKDVYDRYKNKYFNIYFNIFRVSSSCVVSVSVDPNNTGIVLFDCKCKIKKFSKDVVLVSRAALQSFDEDIDDEVEETITEEDKKEALKDYIENLDSDDDDDDDEYIIDLVDEVKEVHYKDSYLTVEKQVAA
jgi:hypothetical protein